MSKLKLFTLSLLMAFSLFSAPASATEKGYTINFENVELKQVLNFISKIGNLNLIYNESEVAFNVTFVSDKETSLDNVKSALVQILRIHNLSLIEEGNNLIIHKNPAIKQIPTVISSENPLKGEMPAIITRVFKIHRGNPTNIAALLTPLLSTGSMIEVSLDTRQIIITDVPSSIATVEQLLKSLDMPETPYDIDSYSAVHIKALELQVFAQKIMKPLTENTTLEIVAQPDTNTVYIISTPFLIDKTLSLLEELDNNTSMAEMGSHHYVKGKLVPVKKEKISNSNVLIYPLKHKSREMILSTLDKIIQESKDQGLDAKSLKYMIEHAAYVRSTHSLVFVGKPENLALMEGLLQNIDTSNTFLGSQNASFFLFDPKGMNSIELVKVIKEISENLKESAYPNQVLLHVLANAKPIPDLNSILFVVPPDTRPELVTLLNTILSSYDVDISKTGISHFYLYNIKNASEELLRDSLETLKKYLKNNDYPNKNLIKTISSLRWIKASHSLFFVGTTKSLQELSEILPSLDVTTSNSQEVLTQAPPATEFIVFTPKNTDACQLKQVVLETAKELKISKLSDPSFMACLESVKVLGSAEQLLFTGVPEALTRLNVLLEKLDLQSHGDKGNEPSLFLYEPRALDFTKLQPMLEGIVSDARDFQSTGYSALAKTVDSMRQVPNSKSIQFMGTSTAIKELQTILAKIDREENATGALGANILVYKVKAMSPNALMTQIKSIAREIKKQNSKNRPLFKAIESVRYVKNSNSLVFVGAPSALATINKMLNGFDTGDFDDKDSSQKQGPTAKRHVEGYQIYIPQYIPGPELIQMIKSFEGHLVSSGMMNAALSEVIDHLSYVQKTHTVIVSGEKSAVEEVIALFKQFDTLETLEATGGAATDSVDTISEQGFLLYKIQNSEGDEIVSAMKQISSNLKTQEGGAVRNKDLIHSISSIQWIQATNSLIATGPPNILNKLDQLLKSIDRPLAQVFIEVLVIDTSLSDELTFGLSWQNKGTFNNNIGYSLGNLQPQSDSPAIPFANNLNGIDNNISPTGAAVPPLGGGYMGIIGDLIFHNGKSYSSIGSLLNALKTKGDTTVVLSQKIVTQDNQNAKIFSGSNVPFTGSLVTTSGLSQTTNANLEYRNIGVTLSITPNIANDGMITLQIDQELSEESGDGTGTGLDSSTSVDARNINGIRTAKTNMSTRIRVPDRHFLILSGTMRNSTVRNVSGIPCLGGLPLIGAAFNKTEKSFDNRNVIMFVKPYIIRSSKEHVEITDNQEKIYSSDDQCNVEDFEDGLELVRSADDDGDYDDGEFFDYEEDAGEF
ncbi:MAG: Type 3 secretion system secretin [Chlamydiia bacterium]|nr:Type 3 secretion system secretin [Chlamydiia bacterium]MCH9618839.1 Type 3 secretion system secretin [Chlamydiia bacterium]MCH9624359.1 Type 3 secretion system secretin [Chlamydiia bacterium]